MSPVMHGPAVRYALTLAGLAAAGIAAIIGWRIALPSTNQLYDLQVYIDALSAPGSAGGLYGFRTSTGLGFTYPPSAAILMLPLAHAPGELVNVVWTVLMLVSVAFMGWTLSPRGAWRLALAATSTAVLLQSIQVQSGLVAGNVSVMLVAMCLADVGHAVPARLRGVLTGVAAAIKLTPLGFLPHFLFSGQRATLLRAGMTFVGLTTFAALVRWNDTVTYWTDTIFTRERIGDAAFAGNVSVTGTIARLGLTGAVATFLWLAVAVAVLLLGYRSARELARSGDHVAAAIVVGCATVVASPVSWPFHAIWLPLAGIVLLLRRSWPARVVGAIIVGAGVLWTRIVETLGTTGTSELMMLACLFIAARGLGRAPQESA